MENNVYILKLTYSIFSAMQMLKINPKKKDIRTFEAADFELIGYDPHN